jgi:photosystem II stability/assembly factor-like uncharacterized protein
MIRDSDVAGNGVYRSTDGGKTWTSMGLENTGRIGRIVAHPTNPDIAFVCAVGRATGPQQERGVFRTIDGGQHWDRVAFVDEKTGCSGLAMDPHNPRTLFAGMWQVELHTWAELSGGPGSGVYVSRDGGAKWTHIEGHGLPASPVGKIDVAVAPSDSNRVYALIQTQNQGALWRSDDGGENWHAVNYSRQLIGRAGYYIRIAVSSGNADEVYVSSSSFHVSVDGGETFKEVGWGGDNHDIWVDPANADHIVVTDDGGLNITTTHGRGFRRITLPIGQMYHVDVDNQVPYYFYSNMQDDGNMRGPSVGRGDWDKDMGGCESGFTAADQVDANIVWETCYGAEVTRWDARNKKTRNVSPVIHTLDSPPNEVKYRCHWTPPLAIDPFDHNTVYYGCQVIFKTSDAGVHWSVISPDLSTNDPSHIISSGGLVGDNLGQFYGEVVFAIAPSKIQKGLIWAGTNDGQIWYTKDSGGHWNNVTKNISGLLPLGTVTSIEPSHFDPGTAYASVDLHLADNRDPFILKTTDFGNTWTTLSGGLPKHELSYVRIIAEDPNCKGLLFAGTGNGLFYSLDDGAHWDEYDRGLPHAPVSWAVVQKNFHDLVISTYGRGIYILDDITPFEQMAKGNADAAARLFEPRSSYRFSDQPNVYLNFWLKSAPKAAVEFQILDGQGKTIRKFSAPGKEGINRATWDMKYEPAHVVALRTAAPDNSHIWEERRFRSAESRPITHWGIYGNEQGPIAAPGKYTVQMTVDGRKFTQPLTVLADPRATSSQADLELSVKTLLRIRDHTTTAADIVNQMEFMRKQLGVVTQMLRAQAAQQKEKEASKADGKEKEDDFLKSIEAMEKKLADVEFKFISPVEANSDDKYFAQKARIYMNLMWLQGRVGTGAGNVVGNADFPPAPADLEWLASIEKDLAAAQADYRQVMEKDLPAFNHNLMQHGMTPIAASGSTE